MASWPRFHESTIWGIIKVGFVLHPDQWFVLQDGALCAKDHLITVDVTMPSIRGDGHSADFSENSAQLNSGRGQTWGYRSNWDGQHRKQKIQYSHIF